MRLLIESSVINSDPKSKRHLERWARIVPELFKSGRTDPEIVGILMTESFFRGPAWRLLEFLVYNLLVLIRRPRAKSISLGIAQVQARHWTSKPHFDAILSAAHAYDTLCIYLRDHGRLSTCLRNKVAVQVGEVRGYYLTLAENFTNAARKWIERRRDNS